jgi:hypothetical protein
MSLVVAKRIPAFADLDIETYVNAVDSWAEEVRRDTERHWYRFERAPEKFDHSEADFKIAWLASDINQLFEVDYDVLDFDYSDPSNLFINGIVDRRRGTCVSMPMLYVAIGWRLGYPIKLVQVPTHVFARWDDDKERINIEATGYGASYPDSHYETEFFVSPWCKEEGGELASMSPRQMLGTLLLARCSFWASIGADEERFRDVLRANLLYPTSPLALATLGEEWGVRWQEGAYARHAVEHLAAAGRLIEERERRRVAEPDEDEHTGTYGGLRPVAFDANVGGFETARHVK